MRTLAIEMTLTMSISHPEVDCNPQSWRRSAAAAVRDAIARHGLPEYGTEEYEASGWRKRGYVNLYARDVIEGNERLLR